MFNLADYADLADHLILQETFWDSCDLHEKIRQNNTEDRRCIDGIRTFMVANTMLRSSGEPTILLKTEAKGTEMSRALYRLRLGST